MDPNDRKYSNDEITVYWKPAKCIHATTCYRELISVFNPRKRPWVDMDGAPTEQIIEIVRKCPTDALTFEYKEPGRVSDKPPRETASVGQADADALASQPVEIRIMKNGPYVVEGSFRMIGADGDELKPRLMTSFCRCGVSETMPFCDGSHRIENFSHSCD